MSKNITPEVLELASRYYEQYSLAELIEAGKEVNIPAEIIKSAYLEVKSRKERQRYFAKCLVVGCAVFGAGTVLWIGTTYNALQSDLKELELARLQLEVQKQRKENLIPQLEKLSAKNTALLPDLRYEVIGVENRLSVERRRFNAKAIAYNQKLFSFPNNLILPFLGLKQIETD